MDISLAFENEEEFAVGGFDGVCADDGVRFETIDCALAILLGGVVGAFIDVVAAGIVECVEILLSAVFFVNVLDDIFAVDDGFVKTCDLCGSFLAFLGVLRAANGGATFLMMTFLSLFALRASISASLAASFLARAGDGVPS